MADVLIIGTGFIGNAHATACSHSKLLNLAAICDVNEEAGKKAAETFGCRYYKDAEEMLTKEKADVLDICLPTFLHEKFVLLAAKHKKNVICEKPVTLTLESMDRMIKATKDAGVRFMVAQVIRFWPEYTEIKKLYDQGKFGDIKMVYASRLAQHPNWTEWHKNPKNSGGGLFDLHLHDIDFLRYIFGEAKSVYAVGWQSESGCWNHVTTSIVFKNGVKAVAEGAFDMTEKYPFTMSFRIVGENRTADYKLIAGLNLEDVDSSIREAMLFETGSDPKQISADTSVDAYQAELEYFADCVVSGKSTDQVPLAESKDVVRIILAIQKSLETGEVVNL
jgi:predicted dehydrogenase